MPLRLCSPRPIAAALLGACGLLSSGSPLRAAEDPPVVVADEEPVKAAKPLSIPIPLPIGDEAKDIKIPQYSLTGQLLSQLKAVTAKRLDEKRFELQHLVIDLNKPDGKTDFRVSLPTSIFNTETRIIHSDEPVTISTSDFELQGQRMDFDTEARRGRLSGWVYMKIHNAKEVAAGGKKSPTADGAPETVTAPAGGGEKP